MKTKISFDESSKKFIFNENTSILEVLFLEKIIRKELKKGNLDAKLIFEKFKNLFEDYVPLGKERSVT
jgi:hypothetical protein